KIQRQGSEQKMRFFPACSTTTAELRAGVPFDSTSWQRSQKLTMAVPCTAQSLSGSACPQRSLTRSQIPSSSPHERGYFWRSQDRSSGLGTTKLNQTEAR